MRCKHGMLEGQCGICVRSVTVRTEKQKVKLSKVKRARKQKLVELGSIQTMAQFRKHLRGVARDAMADGFEIEQCAGDLADCQVYDEDVMRFVRKTFPWAKSRLQLKELLADYIVG